MHEHELSRLKDVRFPDEIAALGHVLELIDEMLMTREEAVVKAAGSNQLAWLEFLLETHDGDLMDAVASAAANGFMEAVHRIIQEKNQQERDRESDSDNGNDNGNDELQSVSVDARPLLRNAIVAAARSGQLPIVNGFLPRLAGSGRISHDIQEMYDASWQALNEGAAHGHLNVVVYVVEFATQWGYIEDYTSTCSGDEGDALLLAVRGGHGHVVQFLLQGCLIAWNTQDALAEALLFEQTEVAEWICDLQDAGEEASELGTE